MHGTSYLRFIVNQATNNQIQARTLGVPRHAEDLGLERNNYVPAEYGVRNPLHARMKLIHRHKGGLSRVVGPEGTAQEKNSKDQDQKREHTRLSATMLPILSGGMDHIFPFHKEE
jgi:hypothetical protein